MIKEQIIILINLELRIHDNMLLQYCLDNKDNSEIIVVFSFNEQQYSTKQQGSNYKRWDASNCSQIRLKFYLEAVKEFQENLQKIGLNLLITKKRFIEILPILIQKKESYINTIILRDDYFYGQVYDLNKQIDIIMEENLIDSQSYTVKQFWMNTMLEIDDLKSILDEIKYIEFKTFIKSVTDIQIRNCVQTPQKGDLKLSDDFYNIFQNNQQVFKTIDQLYEEFDINPQEIPNSKAVYKFIGGESEGIKRLNQFIYEEQGLINYLGKKFKLTDKQLSSFMSPYSSSGCISPRFIYQEVKKWVKLKKKEEISDTDDQDVKKVEADSRAFVDHMLIKDYYRLQMKVIGEASLGPLGGYNKKYSERQDEYLIWQQWIQGKTGIPIIDASMRELVQTGFINNRCRQLVGNYLIFDLKQDWRFGEFQFRNNLIDFEICTNIGSWSNVSGLGGGVISFLALNELNKIQRENNFYHSQTQLTLDSDPEGEYVKKWVPELMNIPKQYIHQPWLIPINLQIKLEIKIGQTYPFPINYSHHNTPEQKQAFGNSYDQKYYLKKKTKLSSLKNTGV